VVDVQVAVDDEIDRLGSDADAGEGLDDRRAKELHLADILGRQVRPDAGVDQQRRLRMPDQPGVDDHALARRHRVRRQESADQQPGHLRTHRLIMAAATMVLFTAPSRTGIVGAETE
jgi:hypothetical protein